MERITVPRRQSFPIQSGLATAHMYLCKIAPWQLNSGLRSWMRMSMLRVGELELAENFYNQYVMDIDPGGRVAG